MMNTSCYYAVARPPSAEAAQGLSADLDLEYHSVWSTKYIGWNRRLNQPAVYRFFMFTAQLLMANTLIEEPYNHRISFWGFSVGQVPHWVGHFIFFSCHAVLLGLFVITFSCMWPTRHKWLVESIVLPAQKR